MLSRFLRQVNISDLDALLHFRLAPLRTRRDIALLGVVHRAALGKGPPQLRRFFVRVRPVYGHQRQLYDPRVGLRQDYLHRSALGLVRIYNCLPGHVVAQASVKAFQGALQSLVVRCAQSGQDDWADLFRTGRFA